MPACDQLPSPPKVSTGKPIHLIAIHAADRRVHLTSPEIVRVLRVAWRASATASGWVVGRYVIMPDHVHFFARPHPGGDLAGTFIRNWKKWTACLLTSFVQVEPPIWQPGFIDQPLDTADVYQEWLEYIRANPVRAGHAPSVQAWPFAGEVEPIGF